MKEILLLRHAKSSWDDPYLEDYERPLAKRGREDAPRMGRYLQKIGFQPDYVVSSPANRAKQTSELVLEAAKCDKGIIRWDRELYFGNTKNYLKAIREAPEDTHRILLVGHNPLMENVASALASENGRNTLRMPTAALVCLESYADRWDHIVWGSCQIKWMMIPKVLKKILG